MKPKYKISLNFRTQLEKKEIFLVTGLVPTRFSIPRYKPKDVVQRYIWDYIVNPKTDDLNFEIKKILEKSSIFLPNQAIVNPRIVILFSDSFFPRILRGETLSNLKRYGLSLEIDDILGGG